MKSPPPKPYPPNLPPGLTPVEVGAVQAMVVFRDFMRDLECCNECVMKVDHSIDQVLRDLTARRS